MPFTITAPTAQPFDVLIGPDDGSDVRNDDVNDDVFVASLMRSAGGHRLDHVQLVFSLARTGTSLVDISTPFEFSRRVQVRLKQDMGIPPVCVFSGELAIETAKITGGPGGGEFCSLIARVEPWHFGGPVLGPRQADPGGTNVIVPHVDLIFNPLIDGRVEFNMSSVTDPFHTDAGLWLDPESVRTTAAQTAQGQTAVEWDLINAIFALCWAGNPDPDLIRNPTLAELTAVITDPPTLRNIHLHRGKRLPQLLDDLLPRFGYDWYLEVIKDPDDPDTADPRYINIIRVFQLGAGNSVQLFLQRPNPASPPALDLTQSNVSDLDATWNIADLANEIIGQGSFLEVEATFELYRAWPEADDALTSDELRKTEETTTDDPFEESQFKAKPNVWRKWALNEAGDYCSLRTVVAPIPADPFDFGRESFSISAVTTGGAGSGSFTVPGDWTDILFLEESLEVTDSTGNDGTYTVFSYTEVAGDTVIHVNETISDSTVDGTLTLAGVLGPNTLVKRRRFHHCLTWGADNERRDVFVQYRDPDVAGDLDPGAWKALPHELWSNVGFHVLEKECGIYFSGSTPPPDLMDIEASAGAGKARLRITATLRADDRLQSIAPRGVVSPNANTIPLFVDLSDRFHRRLIITDTASTWKSALASEIYGSDATDDTDLLATYVTTLRRIEQSARVSADVDVFGITTAYQIGDLVTKVSGREISFNRNAPLQETKLYPQITQIVYNRAAQKTTLKLETFDYSPRQLKKLSLG